MKKNNGKNEYVTKNHFDLTVKHFDKGFEGIDKRFEGIDKRFDFHDRRINEIEDKITGLSDKITEFTNSIQKTLDFLVGKYTKLDEEHIVGHEQYRRVEEKVENHESRISVLEKKAVYKTS